MADSRLQILVIWSMTQQFQQTQTRTVKMTGQNQHRSPGKSHFKLIVWLLNDNGEMTWLTFIIRSIFDVIAVANSALDCVPHVKYARSICINLRNSLVRIVDMSSSTERQRNCSWKDCKKIIMSNFCPNCTSFQHTATALQRPTGITIMTTNISNRKSSAVYSGMPKIWNFSGLK